jgi:hypothetical protein
MTDTPLKKIDCFPLIATDFADSVTQLREESLTGRVNRLECFDNERLKDM